MSLGWIIALLCGTVIIAGLAFYLGRLMMQIKHNEAQQTLKVTQHNDKRNKTLSESIYTITWAMRDGQCEYSEGCLRVWVLLDHYIEQNKPDQSLIYPGVFALYDKIKDMPTHEARKKLKNKALMQMDKQRQGFEDEYKSLIKTDITRLLERFGN